MNVLGFYASICVVIYVNINGAYGDDAADCHSVVSKLLESQMNNLVPCIKSLGYEYGPQRADGFYCIMKCMLISGGILTKEGQVTIRQAVEFVLENIPLGIMDDGFSQITKCQKHAGADLADPSDKKCAKYGPLINCSINVLVNLCP